jgi:nucleotide-binding universal stress UspA family protein
MKTIAVLTDFSEASEHASLYALHLAKKIKANVILHHFNPLPVTRQMPVAYGFTGDEDEEIRSERNNNLTAFSLKLEQQLRERSFPGTILPELTCGNEGDELVDIMTSLVNNNDVILIITNPACSEDISYYMLGAHCRQIMDWATIPVMVVPETALIRNLEKIAYTAVLGCDDANYINKLVSLVEGFSPEIMIACLPENAFKEGNEAIITDMVQKVDYGRIYYRRISIDRTERNWKWLNNHKKCDLLVFERKSQNELKDFFNLGYNTQATHHITIPVLILPVTN